MEPSTDYTETQKAIVEMMTESTGMNILDSGGAYGRAWQNNRKIEDFRDNPELKVTVYDSGYEYAVIDMFHWIDANFEVTELTKKLQLAFDEFAEKPGNEDKGWHEIEIEFLKTIKNVSYGKPYNSYNWEHNVGGTYEGLDFDLEGKTDYPDYVFFQYHGGCDVRGGYASPRIFHIIDFDQMLMSQMDLWACCDCVQMSTDGPSSWFGEYVIPNGQKTIDDVCTETLHELPDRWEPIEKSVVEEFQPCEQDRNSLKNYSNDHVLKCKRCGRIVSFGACLDW